MRRRPILLALLAAPFAKARAQTNEAARLQAVRDAVAGHILPGLAAFAAATGEFAAATSALRQDQSPAAADAARQGWTEASLAFQRIRHLRFGPMDSFDHGFRISIFPDTRNSTGRDLVDLLRGADPDAITPEAFARGRVAGQGLPAAERLLFSDDSPLLLRPDQAFRRALLEAIGRNLAAIAAEMQREWITSDRPFAQVIQGAPGGLYADAGEGLLMLFKSLHGGLEFLAERQVARVLGPSLREARPRSAEAWRSGQSLALVQASLDALAELQAQAFIPLVSAADAALAAEAAGLMTTAQHQARDIAPGLEAAVAMPQGRAAVAALVVTLGTLRRLLTDRAAPAIGLPAGFNAMDGD
jgi:predicted lipoprotein